MVAKPLFELSGKILKFISANLRTLNSTAASKIYSSFLYFKVIRTAIDKTMYVQKHFYNETRFQDFDDV